jgi:hypothetical protein
MTGLNNNASMVDISKWVTHTKSDEPFLSNNFLTGNFALQCF